jgi:3-oxoacyl-[acyl-carrier-protein] synthase II
MVAGLETGASATRRMEEWTACKGLRGLVGAPARLENEKKIPRDVRRSMGRMSIFAVQATEEAIRDAALPPDFITSGRCGCVIGSTIGSMISISEMFETYLKDLDFGCMPSTKFFQCLSNTAVMNVANYLGMKGWCVASCGACASAIQAVGEGLDQVRLGRQDAVLCGGAEELHPTVTGSFDVVFATSAKYNDRPDATPRPFDRHRDGLVCGEGCGIVVVEEYEHARRRGAHIYAEITGYASCSSGVHVTKSDSGAMIRCMRAALAEADVSPANVDYINAHATGTLQGDREEAEALRTIFGDKVPVSSLKGYLGHTLAASGTLELIASLSMMAKGVVLPTRNLEEVAEDCAGLFHVQKSLPRRIDVLFKNSFGFGGINTALVCRRVPDAVLPVGGV